GGSRQARTLHAHVLNAGLHELHTHIHGEGNRDQADEARGKEVKDPDVLVVGGHEPAGEEPASVVLTMAMDGGVGHALLPFNVGGARKESLSARAGSGLGFKIKAGRGQWRTLIWVRNAGVYIP